MDKVKKKSEIKPAYFQPQEFNPVERSIDADMVFLQSQFEEISLEEETESLRDQRSWVVVDRVEENWGAENARMKQALRKEAVRNKRLWQKIQEKFTRTEVGSTANVSQPPVQETSARESRKQQRDLRKKQETARKKCPVGDVDTIDFSNAIKTDLKLRDNSYSRVRNCKKRANALRIDERMLRVFCRGHRKNLFGKPATEKDEEAAKRDEAMIEAFLSDNEQARKPYMDAIVDEIISMDFTYDMLTPENITKNYEKLRRMAQLMTSFDNLRQRYPDYFNSLDQFQKDMIEANISVSTPFIEYLKTYTVSRGVDFQSGRIIGHSEDDKKAIEVAQSQLDFLMGLFREEVLNFQRNAEHAVFAKFAREAENRRLTM